MPLIWNVDIAYATEDPDRRGLIRRERRCDWTACTERISIVTNSCGCGWRVAGALDTPCRHHGLIYTCHEHVLNELDYVRNNIVMAYDSMMSEDSDDQDSLE